MSCWYVQSAVGLPSTMKRLSVASHTLLLLRTTENIRIQDETVSLVVTKPREGTYTLHAQSRSYPRILFGCGTSSRILRQQHPHPHFLPLHPCFRPLLSYFRPLHSYMRPLPKVVSLTTRGTLLRGRGGHCSIPASVAGNFLVVAPDILKRAC